jgi:hypothetical protein
MTQIAPRTLRRPQSLAWIAPSGEFIPIEGELMHSDLAESFPGMPPDEIYPTNYAMNHLGYLKVGNAFDFAFKGDEVPRGVDRPAQMDTMAQIVAQAVINFMEKGLPIWFAPARHVLDNPLKWPVYQSDTSDGTRISPSVNRFIASHGSDDTQKWFNFQLRRAEEALIRRQVRTILSEMRRRPV